MIDGTVSFTRRALQLSDADVEARALSQWTGGDEGELLGLAGDGGWPRVERWISATAIQACIPWEADTERPENVLGKLMMNSPAGDIAEAGVDLLEVGRQAEEVASLSGEARSEAVEAVSRRLERIADVVGVILPRCRLIDEDAGCAPPHFVPLSTEEITVLDEAIRPTLFRSRLYDLLLDAFLAEYGCGGAAIDVIGFLTSCSLSTHFRRQMRGAKAADSGPDAHTNRETLAVGVTSAPPSASIFLQRTPEDQNGNLVVNQIMPGLGAVVARFTALGDGPETLRPAIASWVAEAYPDVTDCRALVPGARVNALQRAATAVLPVLDGDDLRQALAQLILRHDVEHNVLEFTRPDGQPVAPVPLGIVPAWTFEGPVALLMTLLNPWIDGTTMTRESHPVFRARRSHDLMREPRVTSGTVVTHRETWRVPADSVPTRGNDSIGRFLMRLHSWRIELGLPEEVFVRVHGDDPFDSATRKPLWLRFTSWHAVSAVWALIPGRNSLEIQECVPTRAPSSPTIESVITMHWERPGRSNLGRDGQSSNREKVAP
ncbi:lantibiotic dehydratase [Rathayibacter tritici]|uniref:lantibiotic dehydratase n=1 Tax=Rathayibacter tritici TaxID=33888 RepID=UPI00142F2FF1|nr:lantibiotic dehydratase [Rathayibacter tritici]